MRVRICNDRGFCPPNDRHIWVGGGGRRPMPLPHLVFLFSMNGRNGCRPRPCAQNLSYDSLSKIGVATCTQAPGFVPVARLGSPRWIPATDMHYMH